MVPSSQRSGARSIPSRLISPVSLFQEALPTHSLPVHVLPPASFLVQQHRLRGLNSSPACEQTHLPNRTLLLVSKTQVPPPGLGLPASSQLLRPGCCPSSRSVQPLRNDTAHPLGTRWALSLIRLFSLASSAVKFPPANRPRTNSLVHCPFFNRIGCDTI